MRLKLTCLPEGVFINSERLPDDIVPQIALRSRVIERTKDGLIVDFQADLTFPASWKLPSHILKNIWKAPVKNNETKGNN